MSPSKDVKRRPSLSSHSLSTSPVRGKGNLSPQKDIKSPSPPKEIVTVGMDEDRENQQGEDHPVNPAEVAAPGSNKLVDQGTGSETVHMAIENSVINIQASRSEVLKNGEAGEQMQTKSEFGLEAPGFKRSLKKSSKDASLLSDDESDGTEMEVMDDWRDDAKALAKENSKSFERARGIIHKSTKEQEEIGVGLGTGIVKEKRTDFNRKNSTVSDVASKQGYDTIDMQLNAQIETFRGIDKKDRQRMKENNQDQLDIVENKGKTRTSADKQYEVKSVEKMRQEKENGRSPVSKDVGKHTKIRNEVDASMAAEEVVIFGPKPILKETEVAESKTVSVEMISDETQSKAGGVKVNLMKDGLEGTATVLELDNKEEDDIEEEETAKHKEMKTSERDEEGERHERHRKERHRSHRKKHGEEDDELGTGDDGEKNEDGDTRKERRRHKKKHKTDEETDKGDRKRRKHKHHRKRRSPSLSPELFPSVNSSKSKQGIDDSVEKHKHHQRKRHPSESQELSPSEDQGKGWGTLDDAAARKKNSNRHKRSRREPSKSQSESLSLSD